MIDIQDKQVNEVNILTIQGSIDALTAEKIMEHIHGVVAQGWVKLVADFGGVDYTSSSGLRMLLEATKETRSRGGDLYLADIQPDVEKVLKLSGFTGILNIFPDIDSAVEGFA